MSNNYTLGRGELHFGQFRPGTQTARGERYLGNSPDLNFSAESETLDHYNSDRGIRTKDASVILQTDYAGTFIVDNISHENLAMFFLGESLTQTTTEATGQEDTFIAVEPGFSYQLGTTPATPTGARNVVVRSVSRAGGGTGSYQPGADYVYDAARGRLTVLEGGAIEAGSSIRVTYDIQESTRPRVISRADTIEGQLRYLAHNPTGENIDYFMPWVRLTPNGDFTIKGDEWQELPFNIEILRRSPLEAIYADGQAYTPTPDNGSGGNGGDGGADNGGSDGGGSPGTGDENGDD